MKHEIKALPTYYKGVKFKSRLEARWAVYFDYMGISWQYEPQGFDLGDGIRYLPDFLLNGYVWAEVKAGSFDEQELEKCRRLTSQSKQDCLLLSGPPDAKIYEVLVNGIYDLIDGVWVKQDWVTQYCTVAYFKHNKYFFVDDHPDGITSVFEVQSPKINAACNAAANAFSFKPKTYTRLRP
jgi:hypothetical protein